MSERGVFVREATGLVREMGFLEHFTINANALPLVSLAITPWYIWVAVPGGDPIIATVLGLLFTVFGTCLCYAMTTATFPRSGAPYVTQSRVLHPAIGWPSEVLMWFGWIMFLGIAPSMLLFWAIAPGLYAMGVSSGNQALINAAWALINPVYTVIAGTIILIVLTLITIAGTRFLARNFNLPIIALMYMGVVLFMVILARGTPEQFVRLTPKYLHQDYSTIIATAKESYPSLMVPLSFAPYPLLASIGLSAGAVNTYWNSWAAGEIKRAGVVRTQVMAMVISSIITALISVVGFALAYNVAGREFLLALTQHMTYNVGFLNAPFFTASAAVTFVPMMLADNPYLQFLLMIAYAATVLAYFPVNILVCTRDMFAWAFDRLLPSKFAEVSERWHTPVFTIVFNMVLGWIFLIIFTYFSAYVLFFFAASWNFTLIAITLLCLAAMLLPFRKHLWDLSPAKKYMMGAVPAITIFGAIGTFYNGLAVWIYSTAPAMGFGLASLLLIIVISVIPFFLYWVIRAIRRRQGINLDILFREVPPE
jgi:amino acid transporter